MASTEGRPSFPVKWAKSVKGRIAPSISGVTMLCDMKPPLIPILSAIHSS